MATVTGLTADRMLQIEAESIVSGSVDANGHLQLTTHGGSKIDAGDVVGPPIAVKIAEKPVDDIPSNYPSGVSIFEFSTTAGWPTTYATVMTVLSSATRAFQLVTKKSTGEIWIRSSGDSAWGVFTKLATTDYVDNQISTQISPLASKSYVDNLVISKELGNGVDLNTLTSAGVYSQSSSSEATGGVNYPVGLAGILEVFANATSNPSMAWQRYTPYGSYGDKFYQRTYSSGTWSAWKVFVAEDNDWKAFSPYFATNVTNNTATGYGPFQYRIRGDVVELRGSAVTTVARTGNWIIGNAPAEIIPAYNQQVVANSGPGYSGYGVTAGMFVGGMIFITNAGVIYAYFGANSSWTASTYVFLNTSYPLH